MRRVKQATVLNSDGSPVVLNAKERFHANWMQKQVNERFGNSLGYEVPITTLTSIVKKISVQKFFEIAPADYIPIVTGNGQFMSNLTTYRSFDISDEFESGIINLGGNNARKGLADAAIDAVNVKINNWNKGVQWTIFELEEAARSGNWDLVSAREKTRKRNWDLGIQRIAFLGARGMNGAGGQCLGLFNQPGVTFNTTLITQALGSMTSTQLSTFQQGVIAAYRINCNYTCYPTHFIIPESDYNSLVAQASPSFPMKSILQLLEEGFQVITRNKSFKVLPLAYGDKTVSGLATQMYCLYNYEEESLRMDVPLPYMNTLANSIDNFNFQNSAYGQFTGVVAYRPAEMMYFGF